MKFLLLVLVSVFFSSCSSTKTKQDCVYECKERGAEYAGVIPDARRHTSGWGTQDVCQCR